MRCLARLPAATAALTLVVVLVPGCTDSRPPTDPAPALKVGRAAGAAQAGGDVRTVIIQDACDPTTFDAALQDPNACARKGGMKFDQFISQLTKHGEVGAWHFSPPNLHMKVGQTLLAVNKGGETHTFTEVEHFGGGIVPLLNQLSGNPVPVPECLALEPDDFIPPGGTYAEEEDEGGVELYQCCIHPWMRLVRHAR